MGDDWKGDELIERVARAERWGVDKVMADCVIHAKQNHPGWKNVTSTAEGSIRVVSFAQADPRGGHSGQWGSADVDYMIWLELKHGSALRNSADVNYPALKHRIAEAFKARA